MYVDDKLLMKEVVLFFGVPKALLSDRRTNPLLHLLLDVCSITVFLIFKYSKSGLSNISFLCLTDNSDDTTSSQ